MTLAYIPSPTISQFSIGPVTIHIYALCILMGIVLAVWITTTRWKKLGGNFDQVLDITLVSVPAGIIGARLYHIITTPERFFGPDGDWAEMFRIWNGGLGIWGGVLFGALAAWAVGSAGCWAFGQLVQPGTVWRSDNASMGFETQHGRHCHRA